MGLHWVFGIYSFSHESENGCVWKGQLLLEIIHFSLKHYCGRKGRQYLYSLRLGLSQFPFFPERNSRQLGQDDDILLTFIRKGCLLYSFIGYFECRHDVSYHICFVDSPQWCFTISVTGFCTNIATKMRLPSKLPIEKGIQQVFQLEKVGGYRIGVVPYKYFNKYHSAGVK